MEPTQLAPHKRPTAAAAARNSSSSLPCKSDSMRSRNIACKLILLALSFCVRPALMLIEISVLVGLIAFHMVNLWQKFSLWRRKRLLQLAQDRRMSSRSSPECQDFLILVLQNATASRCIAVDALHWWLWWVPWQMQQDELNSFC